ncbi:EAL domain-containing protein [Curvivirga sp.]|uniref:EAL domain-containing protein n=1 Tax=Curvivirga sp. TaxID=2856848 RepID=UPI003B5C7C6E
MVTVLRADGKIDAVQDNPEERFMLVVDEVGNILRGNKNALTWLDQKPQDLAEKNIADILAPPSQMLASDIIVNAVSGFHMDLQPAFVFGAKRLVKGFQMMGEPVDPDGSISDTTEYRLRFQYDASLSAESNPMNSAKGFANSVNDILKHSEEDLDMTFVSVGDVDGLATNLNLSKDQIDNFTKNMEDRLRESSLDQAALGQVSSGKYGVLHKSQADLSGMHEDIKGLAQEIDPEGKALNVETKTMSLDADGLEDDELADALSHAIDSFAESGLDDLIYDNLGSAHTAYLDHKSDRLSILKEVISKDQLSVVYQPVVNVHKWCTDHLWAEIRADLEDDGLGVEEIIKFTRDNLDLRVQVDEAQCRFIETDDWYKGCPVAITLHVRSLLKEDVVMRLLKFASTAGDTKVILRISGFSPNDLSRLSALSTLKQSGFSIALYGEELGAINSQMLTELPADYIILEDGFTESTAHLKASLAMLEKMEQRCLQHDIKLVFDGIREEDTATALAKLKVAVATGSYFGDHVSDLADLRYPIQQ